MLTLIILNMLFNAAYTAMALSEMTGWTDLHSSLPRQFKWVWICSLALGNLVFHVLMIRALLSA